MEIQPLTPTIGAVVHGVDMSVEPDEATVTALRQALLDHLVIFFRDQDLDDERHLAFALKFGKLSVPPLATAYQDTPAVTVLDQVNPKGEGADQWHSDNSFMAHPPLGSLLRCVQLPRSGGDTCFASSYAAYESLPEALRSLANGLQAVHDITKPMRKALLAGHTNLDLAETQRRWPPVTHPVVMVHPETGRRRAVRQPQLDHPHRRAHRAPERGAVAAAVRSVPLARHPVSIPVGAWVGRVLGQPVGAALHGGRLHRASRHAPCHHRRRPGARTPALIGLPPPRGFSRRNRMGRIGGGCRACTTIQTLA